MAWRIDENVSHGELDFTTRGRVLGRIVIEAAHYQLQLDTDPTWQPSPEEEARQRENQQKAMAGFMESLAHAATLSALDSADQENLATPTWRQQTRLQTAAILAQVQQHIDEAREVLRNDDTNDD